MKKDWKYIIYLSIVFGLFLVVRLTTPRQFSWNVTYSHKDKNPYGTFALNSLLPDLFENRTVRNSYQTLYELKDSLARTDNVLIVASNFHAGKEDLEALLGHVHKGGSAFVSAQYFASIMEDTLDFSTKDYLFENTDILLRSDTTHLRFTNPAMDSAARYYYKADDVHQFFNRFDTARFSVVTRNSLNQPVTLKTKWGDGVLLLNCTPMAFTNIYLLEHENHSFASRSFSYLPPADVERTEFYHLGRMESATPLRFILSNEALRWAYYLTVISILLFMIFEAKRKQRIIPIIPPLPNTTVQFVATIGNLYFQHADHKNIADKKINFLLEQIRSRYFIPTNKLDDTFIRLLAQKSGKPEGEVIELFNTVNYITRSTVINVEILIDLNDKIEKFNR
jgi:hypothetical protein